MTRAISNYDVVPVSYQYNEVNKEPTHLTAREVFGICRECGGDIPGGHESMKCFMCRTSSDEWRDEEFYA